MKLSRRDLLRSAPLAALPFLSQFASSRARASGGVPLRFFVYASPQGTVPGRWMPSASGGMLGELSELLMPLTPYRDKINIVTGVNNVVARRYHNSNGHNAPGHTLLNAHLCESSTDSEGNLLPEAERGSVGQPTLCVGPSIDHYLADRLGLARPINFATGRNPGENRMFYQVTPNTPSQPFGARAEAPLINDPSSVFDDYLLGLGDMPMMPPEPTLRERLDARRARVLDTVRGSLNRVGATLSANDRLALEAHASRLSDIQRRLEEMGTMPPVITDTCNPVAPTDWAGTDALYKASFDVAVELLACGVSQVTSFQDTNYHGPSFDMLVSPISDRLSSLGARPLPGAAISDWHAQVHGDTGGDPAANENLAAGYLYYASQFAYLLGRMDSIVEANGATLLDNSVVLWISEFGTGQSHSTSNLPIVLAGGACGQLPTGRLLDRSGSTTADLYTSILQLFGVPDTSFGYDGDSDLNNGGLGLV